MGFKQLNQNEVQHIANTSFLTNGIQALQHQWKKCVDWEEDYVENKLHLVTFHECILVSLWTFQLILTFPKVQFKHNLNLDNDHNITCVFLIRSCVCGPNSEDLMFKQRIDNDQVYNLCAELGLGDFW